MKTRDLAERLAAETDADVIEALLLNFLVSFTSGCGQRLRQRNIATRAGMFWLPCICCGRWTGGHEQEGGSIRLEWDVGTGTGIGRMICDECTVIADRINGRWPQGIALVTE